MTKVRFSKLVKVRSGNIITDDDPTSPGGEVWMEFDACWVDNEWPIYYDGKEIYHSKAKHLWPRRIDKKRPVIFDDIRKLVFSITEDMP